MRRTLSACARVDGRAVYAFPAVVLLLAATSAAGLQACAKAPPPPDDRARAAEVSRSNKAVVVRLYEEVFNQQKTEALAELISPQFTSPQTGKTGVEGMASAATFLRQAFGEELRFTLEDVIGEADRVAVRWTLHGRHTGEFRGSAATGRPIELPAIAFYRLVDGRIVETWQQMGMLRPANPQAAAPARQDRR